MVLRERHPCQRLIEEADSGMSVKCAQDSSSFIAVTSLGYSGHGSNADDKRVVLVLEDQHHAFFGVTDDVA